MKFDFREFKIEKKKGRSEYYLSFVELPDYADWDAKKVYYLTGTAEGEKTGSHCHRQEKEIFAMVSGTCTAVIDRGNGIEEFKMQGPESAIYVGTYVWHHFKDFSKDAVLLAISSHIYSPDRSDYIDDYEEYRKEISLM